MNDAKLEHSLSSEAERELLNFDPSAGPKAARDIPKTHTLATPLAPGFSTATPTRRAEPIRSDAAVRFIENAKAENERARRAINQVEMERQIARAEAVERFRVRAEDLIGERERELTRIDTEYETKAAGPLALLRVSARLLLEEQKPAEAGVWTRN